MDRPTGQADAQVARTGRWTGRQDRSRGLKDRSMGGSMGRSIRQADEQVMWTGRQARADFSCLFICNYKFNGQDKL